MMSLFGPIHHMEATQGLSFDPPNELLIPAVAHQQLPSLRVALFKDVTLFASHQMLFKDAFHRVFACFFATLLSRTSSKHI